MADDRPASVLTDAQRAYLRGEKDYRPAVERDLQSRLRKRVRAAVEDLALLVETDREQFDVVDALSGDEQPPMWALPALLFLWTDQNRITAASELSDPDSPNPREEMHLRADAFDQQVNKGVLSALEFHPPDHAVTEMQNSLTVDIGPPVDDITPEELVEFNSEFVDTLWRSGEIDDETYLSVKRARRPDNFGDVEASRRETFGDDTDE
jgi:hypothetical protein